MSMKAENGNEGSRAVVIVAAVVLGALVLYVLAPGPLLMMEKAGMIPAGGIVERTLRPAMEPLRSAAFVFEPVADFYRWWLGVCGVK